MTKFQHGDKIEVRQNQSHWDPPGSAFRGWIPAIFLNYSPNEPGCCYFVFDGDSIDFPIKGQTRKLRLVNPLDRLARET